MKLEIGPEEKGLGKGWFTIDVVKRPGVDVVWEWGARPLPFDRDSVEIIYASHVLEHIPWWKTVEALRDAWRVLKTDGTIEIWVPNFCKIAEAYMLRECGDAWRAHNPTGDPMLWVNGRIFTRGPGPENMHRAVFDPGYLKQCLENAGFVDVKRLEKPRGYDHGPINLGMSGRKP